MKKQTSNLRNFKNQLSADQLLNTSVTSKIKGGGASDPPPWGTVKTGVVSDPPPWGTVK